MSRRDSTLCFAQFILALQSHFALIQAKLSEAYSSKLPISPEINWRSDNTNIKEIGAFHVLDFNQYLSLPQDQWTEYVDNSNLRLSNNPENF